MGTAPLPSLQYEIEKSTDDVNNTVTTIKCHGAWSATPPVR